MRFAHYLSLIIRRSSIPRMCLILLMLIPLLKAKPVKSQPLANNIPVIGDIYRQTLNYQFRSAENLIAINEVKLKNEPSFHLAVINYYWWRLVSSEYNPLYSDMIEYRLKLLEKLTEDNNKSRDPEFLFSLISAYAFSARVDLHRNAWFSAMNKLSRYHSTIRQSFGMEATYQPFQLTSGLYHYFMAHARDNMPVIRLLSSRMVERDKSTGKQYLKEAARSADQKIRNEAIYFLMKIAFEIENQPSEALANGIKLINESPDNLLFHHYLISIYVKLGNIKEASAQLHKLEKSAKQNEQISNPEKLYFLESGKNIIDEVIKEGKR